MLKCELVHAKYAGTWHRTQDTSHTTYDTVDSHGLRHTIRPLSSSSLHSSAQVGFKTAVISGGFSQITDRVKDDLGLYV